MSNSLIYMYNTIKSPNNNIGQILLKTPMVVTYSPNTPLEVKPGIYSPIFINMKSTLTYPDVRFAISQALAELIGNKFDYICGMESGGSYYASVVSDVLSKPLILFRKETKAYGDLKRIVGEIPKKGTKIAIIDDVFATGITISQAVDFFKRLGCDVEIFSIFSYGYDKTIGERLGVSVKSLATFEELCIFALEESILTNSDVKFLKEHVATYEDYLVKGDK